VRKEIIFSYFSYQIGMHKARLLYFWVQKAITTKMKMLIM